MNVRIWFLSDRFDFGAHRGSTVEQVLRENPSYINWAFKNTNRLNLSLEVAAALKEAMRHPSYREKLPNGCLARPPRRRRRARGYRTTPPTHDPVCRGLIGLDT